MTTSPSVSVIIPVLNTKEYLDECLDSLLKQSLDSLEIICVDNGSTDGSLELLIEYSDKHPNINVIQHPLSGRLGGARNAGLRIAQGEYIGFVDSDDFVSQKMFEDLYHAAIRSNAEIAICNILAYYQKDNHKAEMLPSGILQADGAITIHNRPRLLRNLTSCNKLFSSSYLKEHRISYPEGVFHEDQYYVSLALLLARRVVTLPKAHYVYRKQRSGAIGQHQGAENLSIFKIMNSLKTALTDRNCDGCKLRLFDELFITRVLILLQSTQSVLWPEFKKQLVAAHALRPEQLKEPCILSPNELREYAVLCEMPIVFFQLYLKLRTGYGMLRSKIAFLKTSLPR